MVIPIQDAVQTVKKYNSNEVMRYIRSATNSIHLEYDQGDNIKENVLLKKFVYLRCATKKVNAHKYNRVNVFQCGPKQRRSNRHTRICLFFSEHLAQRDKFIGHERGSQGYEVVRRK